MYHIKEDKRAKASVELICDGLKRCLKEKSFESVTISDIQRVSGVSRSTFYRNFDRIEDVLALMCDRVFEEAFLSDYANISEAVFRTWFRHQELIETIVGIDRGDGLKRCLKEKSFESVTISDIQRVSGVSRSTFYRNFDRIEDVLALMCDRVFEEAFLSDYANISEAVFRTWFRHQELIETIVGIDRGDMLYASLRRCTSRMRSGLPESGDAALLDYLASIIASSMMGIMITWVERGKKESEEELKGMILQSFKAMKFIGLM